MWIDQWGRSEVGARDENQDFLGQATEDGAGLFVLADGLGGHGGGRAAAELGVQAVLGALRPAGAFGAATLRGALLAAHDAVCAGQRAERDWKNKGMRTTIVALWLRGGEALWGHVGDSRLYRLGEDKIVDRTRDDTVVEVLFRLGEVTEEEMGHHPERSTLLRTLGGDEPPRVQVTPEPLAVGEGTRFLLCSDGLWEGLDPRRIEELSQRHGRVATWGQALLSEAMSAGGSSGDNLSLWVVEVGSSPGGR